MQKSNLTAGVLSHTTREEKKQSRALFACSFPGKTPKDDGGFFRVPAARVQER